MKAYEIINPSDPYTLVSDDPVMAGVAILILGNGQLGLTSEEGEDILPLVFFGGDKAVTKWLEDSGIEALSTYVDENREGLAKVLESVLIGKFSDRRLYEKGLELIDSEEKRQEWWAEWLDERRTSLNNIGSAARDLATRIRQKPVNTTEK